MAEIVALVLKIPSNTAYRTPAMSLDVGVFFSYKGPAQRLYFTAVVTQDTWYSEFDEIGSTKKKVYYNVPASDALRYYHITIRGLPLSGVAPKTTPYGVKIIAEGSFGKKEFGNKACLYVEEW